MLSKNIAANIATIWNLCPDEAKQVLLSKMQKEFNLSLDAILIVFHRLSKDTATPWELVSDKEKQVVLRKIQKELNISPGFIQDISLNPKAIHISEETSFVEFLREDVNGLPILLDLHTYKLPGFIELYRISQKYAISFPVFCLPESIENILSNIKFFGIGEYSGNCLSFIRNNVTRIICSDTLYTIRNKNNSEKVEYLKLSGWCPQDDYLYTDNTKLVVVRTGSLDEVSSDEVHLRTQDLALFTMIRFAEVLLHESAHRQIIALQNNGYDISTDENEDYATLVEIIMLMQVYVEAARNHSSKYIREMLLMLIMKTGVDFQRFEEVFNPKKSVFKKHPELT